MKIPVLVEVPVTESGLCCSAGMRWWLVVASLWLLVALTIPDTQARNRPQDKDAETRRGKRKRDGHGRTVSFSK